MRLCYWAQPTQWPCNHYFLRSLPKFSSKKLKNTKFLPKNFRVFHKNDGYLVLFMGDVIKYYINIMQYHALRSLRYRKLIIFWKIMAHIMILWGLLCFTDLKRIRKVDPMNWKLFVNIVFVQNFHLPNKVLDWHTNLYKPFDRWPYNYLWTTPYTRPNYVEIVIIIQYDDLFH